MISKHKEIFLQTKKQFELVDITMHIKSAVVETGIKQGQITIFSPHTTTSIRLNHKEDLLSQDILKIIYKLVPIDQTYAHDLFEVRQNVNPGERSNGHAHIKSFLFGSSENLIIDKGQIILGDKQSIFFVEFDGGRQRKVHLNIIGE